MFRFFRGDGDGKDLFPVNLLMNAKKYYETSNETIQKLKNKTGQLDTDIGQLDTDIGLLKKKATLEAIQELMEAKKESLEDKQELIKKEKEALGSKKRALKANIKEIYSSHIQTRNYFGQFKRLANENTVNQTQTLLCESIGDLDPSRFDFSKVPSPPPFEAILACTPSEDLLETLTSSVSEKTKETLEKFQQFVIELFDHAKEYENNADDTSLVDDAVVKTTEAILQWEEGKDNVITKDAKGSPYAHPSKTHDNEVKVDQPILQAVICRIIGILVEYECEDECEDECENECEDECEEQDQSKKKLLHEHEYGVTTERKILSLGYADRSGDQNLKLKGRRIDLTTQKPEEFLRVMPPIMLQTAIELKLARDDTTKFQLALEKGKSQIIGHLSKRLEHEFDFLGIGRNASAIGVCLTHLSIEAIQMNLSGVGTKDVDLATLSTGCIPFLGKKMLTDNHVFVNKETEANGFVLLAGVLMNTVRSEDKFTKENVSEVANDDKKSGEDWSEMKYLGSGAFSNVYKVGTKTFLKIPKAASLEHILEAELKILKLLGKDVKDHGIPRLWNGLNHLVQIQAVIRGEISTMKGLKLNGIIGSPLHKLKRHEWNNCRHHIIQKVYTALQYAHSSQIFHLDVRPGNIIVECPMKNCKDAQRCSVMLSDWGCSVQLEKKGKKLQRFRGSTPYAHNGFLGKKPTFTVKPEVDFASLAYTIDHVENGKLRWAFEFDRPTNVTDEDMGKRQAFVCKWLEDEEPFNLSEEIRDDLRKACGIRNHGYNLRSSSKTKLKRKRLA